MKHPNCRETPCGERCFAAEEVFRRESDRPEAKRGGAGQEVADGEGDPDGVGDGPAGTPNTPGQSAAARG